MREVPDGSASLVVTSPPYWDIKNYRSRSQIGLGQSYADYLEQIARVIAECARVLEPGRFACWVVGTRVSDDELLHIPADTIRLFSEQGGGSSAAVQLARDSSEARRLLRAKLDKASQRLVNELLLVREPQDPQ